MQLTGYQLARSVGAPVRIVSDASDYQFDGWRGVVVLPLSIAHGCDAHALAVAAHETAHFLQPRWMPWLRLFEPFRWWIEVDAWRRAMVILQGLTASEKPGDGSKHLPIRV